MTTATFPIPEVRLGVTAEDYGQMPDDGRITELVKGRVVGMPRPFSSHGYYCTNIATALHNYVQTLDIGRVVSNDNGVVTERGPDTVRGPDVAFYSYTRVPKGPLPTGYWPTPELVFEVLSPSDRTSKIMTKVGEYLEAGVLAVCVLDPEKRVLAVYPHDGLGRRYEVADILTLPEVFPDFQIQVCKLID